MSSRIATAECPTCGVTNRCERDEDGFPELDTYPCQGNDDCTTRLCESCVRYCDGCGLPACSEHIVDLGGKAQCHLCVALLLAEAAEAVQEAV